MKNKRFIVLFCFFLGILTAPLIAENEWTVLVYIAADNSLSQQSLVDINEMEAVADNDSVTFIIQVDPLNDPNYPPYFTTSRRYLIQHDTNPDSIGSKLLKDLGEINSAAPQTLVDFANWGFGYAPAKKRMLIIWDHGNGWTKDDDLVKWVCYDTYFGDRMSVSEGELKQAISSIDYSLDILVFDACLMQTTEVISEIYEYCDIVAGSEFTVPIDGIFYGAEAGTACSQYGLFNYMVDNPICSPNELSEELVIRYINSYTTNCQWGSTISFSTIEMNDYSVYLSKLREFTRTYSGTNYNDLYHNAYANCFHVSGNNLDLWEFFNEVSSLNKDAQAAAEDIASLVDSMTVAFSALYQDVLYPQLGRMSVYFPPTLYYFNWELYYNLDFNDLTEWDRFLSYYIGNFSDKPIIEDFSVTSVSEIVNFSWEVVATTDLSYSLYYKVSQDTEFIEIQDSTITHATSYSTSFDTGDYEFKLQAIDEFGNSSSVTESHFISNGNIFRYYPNPFNANTYINGKFLVTIKDHSNAKISIYNLAGELIDEIKIDGTTNGTIEVNYIPENVSSGIYFCLLKSGDTLATIKLAVIR